MARLASLAVLALVSAASPAHAATLAPTRRVAVAALQDGDEYQAATLLFAVARLGCEPEARALLDRGAAIDAKDREGATALGRAAQAGKIAVATLLIDRGADVNARAVDGSTPLFYAAEADRAAMIASARRSGRRSQHPGAQGTRARSPPPPTTARRTASNFCSSTARIRTRSTTRAGAPWSLPPAAPMRRSSSC